MDNVRLRTLTEKSLCFWHPVYKNSTVGDVLEKHPSVILKAYYCLEKVSFIDSILLILDDKYNGIIRIDKPGIDNGLYEKSIGGWWNLSHFQLFDIIKGIRADGKRIPRTLSTIYRKKKHDFISEKASVNHNYNKFNLTAKNHGH
jgi:hypothetical protein